MHIQTLKILKQWNFN